MFSFDACFWNNDVYIGNKKYAANEILTAYLNVNMKDINEGLVLDLKELKSLLILHDDMSFDAIEHYDENVHTAMDIFRRINGLLNKLPPYNHLLSKNRMTLDDILNDHQFFFEDGIDYGYDREPIDWNTVNEYGTGEQTDSGNWRIRIEKFYPVGYETVDLFNDDVYYSLQSLNQSIEEYFDEHIEFVRACIKIKNVFKPFITDYLHSKNTFLNANEVAQAFAEFNKNSKQNFVQLKVDMSSFGYVDLQDGNSKPILCEKMTFSNLLSFIYYDFFNGIKRNHIPNSCKNCGRFFLIRAGKYFNYCDSPTKDNPKKLCRNVGAKRKYDDKCKNDPIWQTYNRAYKAHYARYMKKKMTIAQFEQWSRFASDLRDMAVAGNIEFEEYYRRIRE